MTRDSQISQLRNIAAQANLYAGALNGLRAANLRMHAIECYGMADMIEAGTDTTTTDEQIGQYIADYAAQVRAEIEGN